MEKDDEYLYLIKLYIKMYLLYLDSSGSPLFKEKENYVLSALIINESDWTYIDNKVTEIKIEHFPNIDPGL